jgi:hypothetical protein
MVFDAGGGGGCRTIERKFSRQGEILHYQNFLITTVCIIINRPHIQMFAQSKLGVYSPQPLEVDDFEGIRSALDDTGVCVVQNILTPQEQQSFLNLFWDAIESRKKALSRSDASTWTPENTDWHGTFGAGQYKHYGMAQEKHCWMIRSNPKIRRVFEYGVHGLPALDESSAACNSSSGAPYSREECCVSLDGCAAMFRPAVSGLKLHVDLVPELEGSDFGAVQCAYNMYPVEVSPDGSRANAGFVCVVGSHKMYQKMWADRMQQPGYKPPTKHWHVLEENSPLQDQAVLVTSPANCLVLWRSDVLHKNYGGDFDTTEVTAPDCPPRLPRLTQFVTFMPKRFRTAKSLQRKTQSVLDGCSNNHWAALAFRVPVVPFPAWSAAAKKIPKRIPKFDPSATQPGEACVSREAEDMEDENAAEAAGEEAEVEAEEAPKKRRRKNGAANNGAASSSTAKIPLPTYILDLL